MGMFSWLCKYCEQPILSPLSIRKNQGWMADVTVLFKDSEDGPLNGEYDGYGRIEKPNERPVEFSEESSEQPEIYHQYCWNKAGKPNKFSKSSKNDPNQGFGAPSTVRRPK